MLDYILNFHNVVYHYIGEDNIRFKVLYVLMISIFILFVLTIFFSVFTMFLRYRNHIQQLKFTHLEKLWNPKIFGYINNEVEAEEIFKHVNSGNMMFFVDFLYRFEERLNGKSLQKIKYLAKPYLKYLEVDLKSDSPEKRAKALMTLGSLDDGEYVGKLINMLDDKSPIVSIIAMKTLANMKRIEAFDFVVMHLDIYKDWSKDLLARNLSFFGVEVSEELRFIFFNSEFSTYNRVIAADTLVLLNDLEVHDAAFRILQTENNIEIKAACLRLLYNTHNSEYIDYVRALTSDDHFVIKLYSLKLLGRVGNLSDHRIFIHMLQDREPWIRIHAARALKSTRGIDVLYELAKSKQYGYDAVRQVLSED